MTIKWEAPSDGPSGRRGVWAKTLDELKARPGEWAVIAENSYATLGTVLKKTHADFEFTARNIKGGRAEKIFARYVG